MTTKKINQIDKELQKISSEKMKLENEFKSILYQQKKVDNKIERKKRTKRLIQKGALLEKYFETKEYSVEDTEKLLKQFSEYIKANKPNYFKEKYKK